MPVPVGKLLGASLKYALTFLPYYGTLSVYNSEDPQLQDFPVIDADIVSASPEQFYHLERFPDFILTTGGTTDSNGKFFLLNYDEADLAFRSSLNLDEGFFFQPESFDGLVLSFTDMQHGLVLPPAHGQPVISLPLEVGRHLPLVIRFLREGLIVKGRRYKITELFGSITKLRALTAYCAHMGISGADLGIRRVATMAFHTSRRWARRLGTFWGAELITTYGLTEFSEAVTARCAGCGGYHMPPTVYTEYLSLDLRTSVTAGPALLVLTSLYPYRRCMPLIRYNTRDLVEVLPSCPSTGDRGFRFHGRRNTALLDPAAPNHILLTSLDVLDAVDDVSDEFPGAVCYDDSVARVMSWGSGADASAFHDTGYPALNCEVKTGSTPSLRLTVETDASDQEGSSALEATLYKRLYDLALSRAAAPLPLNAVRVECVQAGTLKARGLPLTLI